MDLWIRSQDRKHLMKCEAIMYEKTGTGYGLIGFTKNYDFNIATYKTKERALEVLDEIQKLLQPIYKVTNDFKKSELTGNYQWIEKQEYIPIQTKVYEMPED